MTTFKKRNSLGKGLEALLGAAGRSAEATDKEPEGNLLELDILALDPGVYQPRTTIAESDLESLTDSIRSQGILQPILVRAKAKGKYEIIAGERRWRAAKMAGLNMVPVIVKDVPNETAMAIALIENIQREDLNPLEEARAMERLAKEFDLTHQQVAEAVGKSRVAVSNALRLLSLNDDVKQLLEKDNLEVGHAKALLGLKGAEQAEMAKTVVSKGLSVRETERLVSQMVDAVADVAPRTNRKVSKLDPDVKRLQNTLSDKLGAAVEIQPSKNHKGKGRIVIPYHSLDELEGILAHIH